MSLTKKQVLEKLDDVKKYITEIEDDKVKQKEEKKFEIKNRFTGNVIHTSSKTTYKEILEEAVKSGANLYGADLHGADLYGADLDGVEMQNVKFYGKGGSTKIKKSH